MLIVAEHRIQGNTALCASVFWLPIAKLSIQSDGFVHLEVPNLAAPTSIRLAPTNVSSIAPTRGRSDQPPLFELRRSAAALAKAEGTGPARSLHPGESQAPAICAMAFFIAFALTFLMWVMTDHSLPKGSSNRALRSP